MNRKEAEDFVYKSYLKAQKFQTYEAKDREKRRNDLTYDLLRKESKIPCCVVTGSKGKGSVANMISQILQTKYTVGLMTSPHIVDFCERFQVNGGKISDEDFAYYMSSIEEEIEAIDNTLPKEVCISPMGIQAYIALKYFQSKKTDFNVFECGKGAKYDDVNNIKHDYAIINTIFLEHTRELGETLEEIAEDKAHVINGEQKCVYVAEQESAVLEVIQDRANKYGVSVKTYGKDFWAEEIRYTKEGMLFDIVIGEEIYKDILIPLLGEHQAKNCALAMTLCKEVFDNEVKSFEVKKEREVKDSIVEKKLIDIGNCLSEDEEIIRNLKKIKQNLRNINWPGRMEVLSQNPFVLLDACINSASCKNVLQVLEHLGIKDTTVIIGIPDDKDYLGVASAMKEVATKIILTKSQNPHYIFTKRQQAYLKDIGIDSVWTESIEEAFEYAKKEEKPIVILGTTSVIAEVKGQY